MLSVNYAECRKQSHYAECRYAECRYAECCFAATSLSYKTMKWLLNKTFLVVSLKGWCYWPLL